MAEPKKNLTAEMEMVTYPAFKRQSLEMNQEKIGRITEEIAKMLGELAHEFKVPAPPHRVYAVHRVFDNATTVIKTVGKIGVLTQKIYAAENIYSAGAWFEHRIGVRRLGCITVLIQEGRMTARTFIAHEFFHFYRWFKAGRPDHWFETEEECEAEEKAVKAMTRKWWKTCKYRRPQRCYFCDARVMPERMQHHIRRRHTEQVRALTQRLKSLKSLETRRAGDEQRGALEGESTRKEEA